MSSGIFVQRHVRQYVPQVGFLVGLHVYNTVSTGEWSMSIMQRATCSSCCLTFFWSPTLSANWQLFNVVRACRRTFFVHVDPKLRDARTEAEAAGEATRKDIEKLRGLHARRVKRLEALLKEEGENLADARREIGTYHTMVHRNLPVSSLC